MSPAAAVACKIISAIRRRELREVWTKDTEQDLACQSDEPLYPGMMFHLARERMEKTDLWKIIEKMPKGALLHIHLEAMIDLDLLCDLVLSLPNLYMSTSTPLVTAKDWETSPIHFQYFSNPPGQPGKRSIPWEAGYTPMSFSPVQKLASVYPTGGIDGFRAWLKSRCTISPEPSSHHRGVDDIWIQFQRTFQVVDSILYYEPVFRACMQQMLKELHEDGIRYVEFRLVFDFPYRRDRRDQPESDYEAFFQAFGEEIEKFKLSPEGKGFHGARMIWTTVRTLSNRLIAENMKDCISIKQKFPGLVAGYDIVGQEEKGRTLADLVPVLFWFKKKCVEAGVDIPFFFHAGEWVGDGDETDHNLFDAILLGARRIGHALTLHKHPLLIDLVKEKKILIECCPISNEVLRLTSSIMTHPLPALLARAVPVALCNDDPTLLGYVKSRLTHDFCQVLNGLENVGLAGLAMMAENSISWSCFEDQNSSEWLRDIRAGLAGTGMKAASLRDWRIEFERFCQWVTLEFGSEVDEDDEDE
ncbi:adenosine deaminase [Histoplasma ohiense]|nr:adenosine deaminase [Histoplasma ohiense (nom. inval.)]